MEIIRLGDVLWSKSIMFNYEFNNFFIAGRHIGSTYRSAHTGRTNKKSKRQDVYNYLGGTCQVTVTWSRLTKHSTHVDTYVVILLLSTSQAITVNNTLKDNYILKRIFVYTKKTRLQTVERKHCLL